MNECQRLPLVTEGLAKSSSSRTPDRQPPDHIHIHHWQEWLESGVDPDIIALNVESLSDLEFDPLTHDVTGTPIADRLNRTYTRFGHQVKATRGWWVSGIDPLNGYQSMEWGRFKPDADTPILDWQKQTPAKYLSPSYGANSSRVTFLRVPRHLWERTAQRYGIPIASTFTEFWEWVFTLNVPIILCEGEKKAACLLTLGYAAIALPGINTGARSKDEAGNRMLPRLIPELQHFATPERAIYVCFDYETKFKTIQAINREADKLGYLFRFAKAKPFKINLPGPQKGVDDFVAAQGADAFDALYRTAASLDPAEEYSRLTFPVALALKQRYLGNLPIPVSAKLVGIKSPKGTGKTEALKAIVSEAHANGQRVLLITHRVQLGQAICDRVGLNYVTELRTSQDGDLLGYGVCVDSLHPESQARFNAAYWKNAVVILDESEQVIWHTLSADTEIRNHRPEVLRQLKELFSAVLESEQGKIILSDADLSNLSLQFVRLLAESKIQPWLCVNEYKPEQPWTIHHYEQTTPIQWLKGLEEAIAQGDKVLVLTHSRGVKSKWSSKTLETYFAQKHPEKRILRIDSRTIADAEHAAHLCTAKFDQVVREEDYDIVIATPTLETGISIDLKGHFQSVWGCFQGVTAENSVRQFLARLREPVDRHIWIAKRGLGQVGNGSASFKSLVSSQKAIASLNLQFLEVEGDTVRTFDDALTIWGRIGCRINASIPTYRETICRNLEREGHTLVNASRTDGLEALNAAVTQVRDAQKQAEYAAIAAAAVITEQQYEELKAKKTKNEAEFFQERKHFLHQYYQTDVDSELVAKDDDGWRPQIRLHYYLTLGQPYLKERDAHTFASKHSGGELWEPTFNRDQLSAKVNLIKTLGLLDLLNPDESYHAEHAAIIHTATIARQYAQAVRNVLGISISPKQTGMQIAQSLLQVLGLKLRYSGRPGQRGAPRKRLYQYEPPDDGRDDIFQRWQERDEQKRSDAAVSTPGISNLNSAWVLDGAA
ncbi:plasmid replication protein, CyRepA1 family [Stenomitos frigidus]|uniref:Bifunctional DNA primase/helicase n=1 Tax=Stenomitos frigidus ULC18 TaxID=2107698 RepID=A0A2T1DY08_9CYAN|nr:plasmid replication protein, CyRepA1 family [Stenomitos frigidus]PSB25370.1 bifunctional DNA primase/helicase [Stenomitos frigidus ULC18]